MICPFCHDPDVRRSRSSHWSDIFKNILGRQAYRCRKCRHRFFSRASTSEVAQPKGLESKHRSVKPVDFRRRKRILRGLIKVAVIVGMFSLFGLFLRHISIDHPPANHAEDMNSPNE